MDCTYPPYVNDHDVGQGRQPMPEVRGHDHVLPIQVYDLVVNWNQYITTGGNACSDGRAAFVAHIAAESVANGTRVVDEALKFCWESYNLQFVPACQHLGITVVEPEPTLRHLNPGDRVVWASNGVDHEAIVIYDTRTDGAHVHNGINTEYMDGLGWDSEPEHAPVLLIFGDNTATGGSPAHVSWLAASGLTLVE